MHPGTQLFGRTEASHLSEALIASEGAALHLCGADRRQVSQHAGPGGGTQLLLLFFSPPPLISPPLYHFCPLLPSRLH